MLSSWILIVIMILRAPTITSAYKVFSHYRNRLIDFSSRKETFFRRLYSTKNIKADFKPELFFDSKSRDSFLQNMIDYGIMLEEDDNLLSALCDPENVEGLEHGITAITVKTRDQRLLRHNIASLDSFTLYERYWYEDLLTSINKRHRPIVILLGGEGTSKRLWQFWYLYRVLQSIHHETPWPLLTAMGRESSEPPQLVIRELRCSSASELIFYLMKEKKVYRVSVRNPVDILDSFSASKVMWLYESDSSIYPIRSKVSIPGIATVSPVPVQYHEVGKSTATFRYQMSYTLKELLTIGQHMRQSITDSDMYELFSPEKITDRFEKFGGNIRRVLPDEAINQDDIDYLKRSEYWFCGGLEVILRASLEDQLSDLNSYWLQWSPAVTFHDDDSGKYTITDFSELDTRLTNNLVTRKVKELVSNCSLEDLQKLLRHWFDVRHHFLLPFLFEEYAVQYCAKHFNEMKKYLAINTSRKTLTLNRALSTYQTMKTATLYCPWDQHQTSFRAYFKFDDRYFVLQVSNTGEKKASTNSALAKCFANIDLPPEDIGKVTVLHFRLNHQSKWQIQFMDLKDTDPTKEQVKKYSLDSDEKGLNTVAILEANVRYFDVRVSAFTLDVVGHCKDEDKQINEPDDK